MRARVRVRVRVRVADARHRRRGPGRRRLRRLYSLWRERIAPRHRPLGRRHLRRHRPHAWRVVPKSALAVVHRRDHACRARRMVLVIPRRLGSRNYRRRRPHRRPSAFCARLGSFWPVVRRRVLRQPCLLGRLLAQGGASHHRHRLGCAHCRFDRHGTGMKARREPEQRDQGAHELVLRGRSALFNQIRSLSSSARGPEIKLSESFSVLLTSTSLLTDVRWTCTLACPRDGQRFERSRSLLRRPPRQLNGSVATVPSWSL